MRTKGIWDCPARKLRTEGKVILVNNSKGHREKPTMKAAKVYVDRHGGRTEQCGTKIKGEKKEVGHDC